MEIFIDGVTKGIVFQGFRKISFFKGYNVHHIIYDRQQIYNMYPIGFGAEGAKMPVYVEECVERQVALTENVTTEISSGALRNIRAVTK